MIFGRRKHAAPTPAVAAPAAPELKIRELTDELVFAAVQRSLTQVFGEGGDWTVARRSDDQTDAIFHDTLVHSIATTVTAGIVAARDANAAQPAEGPLGLLRAPRVEPTNGVDAEAAREPEPAALRWEPAPITRWADLKRPVTGPVAVVHEGKAA